jgi:hypothetical protein
MLIINALHDESYNAAVETLHRWAGDESRSEKQRALFGSLVHALATPIAQLAEENGEYEKRERKFLPAARLERLVGHFQIGGLQSRTSF